MTGLAVKVTVRDGRFAKFRCTFTGKVLTVSIDVMICKSDIRQTDKTKNWISEKLDLLQIKLTCFSSMILADC